MELPSADVRFQSWVPLIRSWIGKIDHDTEEKEAANQLGCKFGCESSDLKVAECLVVKAGQIHYSKTVDALQGRKWCLGSGPHIESIYCETSRHNYLNLNDLQSYKSGDYLVVGYLASKKLLVDQWQQTG